MKTMKDIHVVSKYTQPNLCCGEKKTILARDFLLQTDLAALLQVVKTETLEEEMSF